jgi:zinc transporter ZupT
MELWQYLILFVTSILGGIAGFWFQKDKKSLLQLLLSFSGAYIMGIIALHLMPSIFAGGQEFIGLWVLAGFFIQLLLEQFSKGVEHGHIHAPHKLSFSFVFSVMAGLSIHAFFEGIPLSYYSQLVPNGHAHEHNHLLYGVVMHHIPAAFALVILLLATKLKVTWIWLCLVVFSLMSPLGAMIPNLIDIPSKMQTSILAFAMGSLLHISTVILFEMESSGHHNFSLKKMIAITCGLLISVITLL